MGIQFNINNFLKDIDKGFVNINGINKEIDWIKCNIIGVLKDVWKSKILCCYSADRNGMLTRHNINDGSTIWTTTVPGTNFTDHIFADTESNVYTIAHNLTNSTVKTFIKYNINGEVLDTLSEIVNLIYDNGDYFIGVLGTTIYKLNRDLNKIWSTELPFSTEEYSSLYFSYMGTSLAGIYLDDLKNIYALYTSKYMNDDTGKYVYVCYLAKINSDGTVAYSKLNSGNQAGKILALDNNTLLISRSGSNSGVFKVSASTGNDIEKITLPFFYYAQKGKNVIYLATHSTTYCYDLNLQLLWQKDIKNTSGSIEAIAVDENDTIYLAAGLSSVECYDVNSNLKWFGGSNLTHLITCTP